MTGALYLDTSAVLRAILEAGTTPEIESRIREASALCTSRLSLVEAARAIHRVRQSFRVPETRLADAEREIESVWSRCEIWELTREICDLAAHVAPERSPRTLDALHLATFVTARRRIESLELLTVDDRLKSAAAL